MIHTTHSREPRAGEVAAYVDAKGTSGGWRRFNEAHQSSEVAKRVRLPRDVPVARKRIFDATQ